MSGTDFSTLLDTVPQDVDDPIWPSEPIDTGVGHTSGPEEVRTTHGFLEPAHSLSHESDTWQDRETDGEGNYRPRVPPGAVPIPVVMRAAQSWRGVTAAIAADPVHVVYPRGDRSRVVIVNYGPSVVYLSHDAQAGSRSQEPEPNVIQCPVGASREIRSRADVWAFLAVGGTGATIDIQDEYGLGE